MSRRTATAQQMASSTIQVVEDTSLDRVWANKLRWLLDMASPWAGLIALFIIAAIFHGLWGHSWLAASGVAICAMFLSVLLCLITRQRGGVGQLHATVTPAGCGGWLTAAMFYGVGQPGVLYCGVVFGGTMCLAWNARVVVRSHAWDDDSSGGDMLARLFAARTEAMGLRGASLRILSDGKPAIEGQPKRRLPFRIRLAPGDTQDEGIKKAARFESAHGLPPGAVQLSPNDDRADDLDGVLTDPRSIKGYTMWPGPSHIGGSMSDPLRLGLWQDGMELLFTWLKVHLQIMGMTGAGKSTMAAWSFLAEVITRRDVAVFAMDLSKGDQTLGPLAGSLHAFAKTKAEARGLCDWLQAKVTERTDDLAALGYQSWRPGAVTRTGELMPLYLVWCEEFPRVFQALSDAAQERWLNSVKEARTAGILWVVSLQRADFSQMPTLARGQMAKVCLGVAESADASFGLTEEQDARGARPERWGQRYPGKTYFDALGIEESRIAMPARFYSWGQDATMIEEHAGHYPATGRPLPAADAASLVKVMNAAKAPAKAPPVDGSVVDSDDEDVQQAAEDTLTEILGREGGDDAEEVEMFRNARPDKPIMMPPGAEDAEYSSGGPIYPEVSSSVALSMIAGQIAEWYASGRRSFRAPELLEDLSDGTDGIFYRTGRSRSWLYWALEKLAERGMIDRTDDGPSTWDINHGTYAVPASEEEPPDELLTEAEGWGGGVPGQAAVSAADNGADLPADNGADTPLTEAGQP